MKIALIGYGKMGRLIEEMALQQEEQIVARIDSKKEITKESLNGADVCIDFSHPKSILSNIKKLAELNQTIVVGTTGWYDQLDLVKELVSMYKIGLIYAPNFSIGVNVFLKIVKEAAKLIDKFDQYDAAGYEIHHNQKVDAPSGTAKAITQVLINNLNRKTKIIYELGNNKLEADELHFSSLRVGRNPGEHHVIFDSPNDTISIFHQARDRTGFANGAILAARWLQGKKGLFTINDFLETYA